MSSTIGQPPAWARRLILTVVIGLFLVPILSMLWFTLRLQGGGIGLDHWVELFNPEHARTYRNLGTGIMNSLLLALVTVAIVWVLFLPTIVLVHLRFPKLTRVFELLTVLPIAIPAIVLVVGFAPLYRAIAADLQGMHAATLAEAARTLGASWLAVLVHIIAPGLRRGLTSATLITAAVVLGEFTVSSLLNRVTMQVALVEVSKSNPYAAVITSLLSLVIVFALLLIFASLDARRTPGARSKKKEVGSHG